MLDRFKLTDGRLLGIRNDDASWNYSMTRKLQSTLEASAIEWPALRNHIPCMAHVIQLALGAFMTSLSVKGHTKSWEAHERDQQFGENETIDIRKTQRLRTEGNARINEVSAMRPGLAKTIENVRISWYFESPETNLHIAANACGIHYIDTLSPKQIHLLLNSKSLHWGSSDYGCEDTVELNTEVARKCLQIMGIHTQVAPKSKIYFVPATFHYSRWMDHC